MKVFLIITLWLFALGANAVTIEFPEEELARESVLPIFDNAVAVKSRLVPTAKRFEFGIGGGFAMNEPFFNSTRFGGHVAYHFTETHGILIQGQIYSGGLGVNGKTLTGTDLIDDGRPVGDPAKEEAYLRMDLAPQPTSHFLVNYQISPYYGKMSLFKDMVMNLSFYGLVGLGAIDIGGETTPAFNVGIGQKFYISDRWGIRTDLGLMAYQGLDIVGSAGQPSPIEEQRPGGSFEATPKLPSDFERQMNYDLHLSIALIILI